MGEYKDDEYKKFKTVVNGRIRKLRLAALVYIPEPCLQCSGALISCYPASGVYLHLGGLKSVWRIIFS
jgi:hypothetical protein